VGVQESAPQITGVRRAPLIQEQRLRAEAGPVLARRLAKGHAGAIDQGFPTDLLAPALQPLAVDARGRREGGECPMTYRAQQTSLLLRDHQSARNLLIAPTRCEGLGHFKPATIISEPVIATHTRALAHVPDSILTRRRAFFLLSIRLDYIELPVFAQRPFDEIVEPSFRQLPVFLASIPNRRRSPAILKPLPIHFRIGKTNA
jgi:hypothetical protein